MKKPDVAAHTQHPYRDGRQEHAWEPEGQLGSRVQQNGTVRETLPQNKAKVRPHSPKLSSDFQTHRGMSLTTHTTHTYIPHPHTHVKFTLVCDLRSVGDTAAAGKALKPFNHVTPGW